MTATEHEDGTVVNGLKEMENTMPDLDKVILLASFNTELVFQRGAIDVQGTDKDPGHLERYK